MCALKIDEYNATAGNISQSLGNIMNGLIQLSISKKSKYLIEINKDLHDSNGPNAFPIRILHKSNGNDSKLDCCKCRASANKSPELVNIFANFRITNPNNNQNQTKKNLNKTTRKVKIIKEDDVEQQEEGNAVNKSLVSNNEKKVDEGSGEKLISSNNESDVNNNEKKVDDEGSGEKLIYSNNESHLKDISKEINNDDDEDSLSVLFQKDDELSYDKMDVDKSATKAGIIEITYL